ncbi:MAG: hypothetical protein FWG05_04610 [Kiritimatiellaeota bacterium]|nr:hypothetical protein [Kiritimatiellota bacterium]
MNPEKAMNGRTSTPASRALGGAAAFLLAACLAHAEETARPVKALPEEAQNAFLAKRTNAAMRWSFDALASELYALYNVAIHTESQEINRTLFTPVIPDFYRPTWRELFDNMAVQTQSAWHYDPAKNHWVFAKPEKPRVYYEMELAKDWKQENYGCYTGYLPVSASFEVDIDNMDIYVLGSYSTDNPEEAGGLHKKLRAHFAMVFAKTFGEGGTPDDMREVALNNYPALHFETLSRTGDIWRQWVVVEDGKAFLIVSEIKPEQDAEIWPGVQKMIGTFKIAK